MADPIKHVVVLMLENRSFDHMLGDLDKTKNSIDGIEEAKKYITTNKNIYPGDGSAIGLSPDAMLTLDEDSLGFDINFDPHHEFDNVEKQLGGNLSSPVMNGFIQDTWDDYHKDLKDAPNEKSIISQVMAYFPASTEQNSAIPALHTLAKEFTVCDRWFSSLPGPTWPNRFFALTGTAKGHLEMPNGIADIDLLFKKYDMDTIFNRVHNAGHTCRVYYNDVSLTKLLRRTWDIPDLRCDFDDFEDDVRKATNPDDFPEFVFIEPKYFGLFGKPNDQHPSHDVTLGDNFIADVYNTLRGNDALWNQTLFVLCYDEHGGFYDHVEPPTTIAPDQDVSNKKGFVFDFTRLGVRVPTILASPWIDNSVDHTIYDHTSLLAYLCNKWKLKPLGARCEAAMKTTPFEGLFLEEPRATISKLPKTSAARTTRSMPKPGVAVKQLAANNNQRAFAAMLDYLGDQFNVINKHDSIVDIFHKGDVDSGRRVLRKAEEITSAIRSHQKSLLPETASIKPLRPDQPLHVLMVHGIGHGDNPDDPKWKTEWKEAFLKNARKAGYSDADNIQIGYAVFDDIFEDYPLDAITITRGMALLASHAFDPPPTFGRREVIERGIDSTIRWTAGMVLQWIENPRLRNALNARLLDTLKQGNYDIVCAHSLGGMACYDAFRQIVARMDAAMFNGKRLLTFGSQFAHPAVQSVFGGRIEPLYDEKGDGFAQWYHLFNPHDHVFTKPLPGGDERSHGVVVDFDIEGDPINHDGAHYLGDDLTGTEVMPHLLPVTKTLGTARAVPAITTCMRPSKRRALLVGINDYPDPAMQLNGCVNDVYLISSLLQECGFDPEDIRVLTDRRATRAAMLERLDWLSSGVREGDERVFFYSGHGAQMSCLNADGEADKNDETLVPVDFDWSREHAFTDDEFYRYYSHFPYAAEFVAIFDCCHAGGMTRGGQRIRGIEPPDDLRHRELRWSPEHQMWVPRNFVEAAVSSKRALVGHPRKHGKESLHRRGLGEAKKLWSASSKDFDKAKATYGNKGPYAPLLIYAAGEDELAAEYDHGAISYGAFTFALAKRARQPGVAPSFKALVDGVRDELSALGYQQTPQLAGPEAKREAALPIGLWRKQQP